MADKGMELAADLVLTIYKTSIKQLTTERDQLQTKVAEQAAAIEYLADQIFFDSMNTSLHEWRNICKVARIARTDSKQILAEWLDAQLGEPVAWESESEGLTYENHYSDNVPLFKKPENQK